MTASGNPLVIATVFAASARNHLWYALQKRFIAKTTAVPYDYWVLLNGVDSSGFDPKDVVLCNQEDLGHGPALMQLVERFREHRHRSYLILDSDCFPVAPGWYQVLTEQMARFGKQIAAPVRTENLDLFPHPSALFLHDAALDDSRLELHKAASSRNLLGVEVTDVGCAVQAMSDLLLPLLRTNRVNLHPVAAGVYHHLFYHHGAGSREFEFRILKRFGYYSHWWPLHDDALLGEQLFRDLTSDPDGFIARLMGSPA